MTNPFSKKVVPIKTQQELDKRATDVQYFTEILGAHPQFRITSMCDQCTNKLYNPLTNGGLRYDRAVTSPSALRSRKELALEGVGVTGVLYDPITYVPYPVVTEIRVSKQGELGTTRKTTLSITAYDDNQLLELQKCLFIPGMSVRVEWGFYMPAESIVKNDISDNEANKQIRDITKQYPNYDGLQGLVTNFTFNLVQAQYWNCSVEVISAAEALSEGSTEQPCKNADGTLGSKCTQKVPGKEDKEVSEHRSRLYNYLLQLANIRDKAGVFTRGVLKGEFRDGIGLQGFTGVDNFKRVTQVLGGDPQDVSFEIHQYTGDNRNAVDGSSNSFSSFFTNTLGAGTNEVYMSWAAFEAAVNLYCFPLDGKSRFGNGCLNSGGVILTYHKSLESTDPRVCIIPGTALSNYLLDNDNQDSLKGIPSALVKEGISGGVILSRIRLNVIMLIKHLNAVEDAKTGDFKVKTFITNVLNDINSACGNLWEFEVISNNEDDNFKYAKLSVVDIKFAEVGASPITPYDIPGKVRLQNDTDTRRSILRDLNFNMKMTSAMKTQALYSSNINGNAVSTDPKNSCQASSIKPFGLSATGIFKNLARQSSQIEYKPCEACTSTEEKIKNFRETMIELQSDGVTDASTSQAASLLRQEYANSVYKGEDQHCAGQPLPFELSITIDGVGGFGFGQLITCNRIPQGIRESYDWQVTSVEHTISTSGWITQINTVPRYKLKK